MQKQYSIVHLIENGGIIKLTSNIKLGKLGEKLAENYLRDNGYKIIEKNFRSKFGEIDLIVFKDNILSFVEVKTRKSMKYGLPVEAVNYIKQKHIYLTSEYYVLKNNVKNKEITLDVIEVYFNNEKDYKINHLKRAIEDFSY